MLCFLLPSFNGSAYSRLMEMFLSFFSLIICTMNLSKSWSIMLVEVSILFFCGFLHDYFLLMVMA
jgi:hypothetical protein